MTYDKNYLSGADAAGEGGGGCGGGGGVLGVRTPPPPFWETLTLHKEGGGTSTVFNI